MRAGDWLELNPESDIDWDYDGNCKLPSNGTTGERVGFGSIFSVGVTQDWSCY